MAKRWGTGVGSGMSNRFGPIAKAFESSTARMHRVASRGTTVREDRGQPLLQFQRATAARPSATWS